MKTGRPETNYLEWERSWKKAKILKYATRFATDLRSGERENPTVQEILDANKMLLDLDATREFWIPTAEQTIENAWQRAAAENAMFVAWRRAILEENASRKALNEDAKTRIDLEVKDLKERRDTINKIMVAVLEDMTKSWRDMVEKYQLPLAEFEEADDTVTVREARENGDWLFILKAAKETHLYQGANGDPVLIYQRQEQEKEYVAKMKQVSGDFNNWITRFEDQAETCATVGVVLTDEAKIHYFMNNLNDTIFGEVKASFPQAEDHCRVQPDFDP